MGFMEAIGGAIADGAVEAGTGLVENSTGGKLFDVAKGLSEGADFNTTPNMNKVDALNGVDRGAVNKGFTEEKKAEKSHWDKLGGIAGGIAGSAVAGGGTKARDRMVKSQPSVTTGAPVQNNAVQTQRQQASIAPMEEVPLTSFNDYLNNEKMR